jgi:16S rRNA (cytosine1402-N4)-methyltransferase
MNNILLSEPNMPTTSPHYPVLVSEIIENLKPENNKRYLDCTFGAGGYTQAILAASNCFVTAIDQDPNVLKYTTKLQAEYKERFQFIEGNFANAKELLKGIQYDGVVLDLGVSSMQLDEGERGFSFMRDGNLDMRMNSSGYSAADFIAGASEAEIADVIYKYGEEVQSRQIAKMIVEERQKEPIISTLKLAEIVRNSMHYRKAKIDPATKTFQAIRIYINKELESLEHFLNNLNDILKPGARILVVSFHSLEDSIVKSFFKAHSAKKVARSKYAKEPENNDISKWLKTITKKPILPTSKEILENHRSRSARLRVAEKLGGSK